MIFDVTVVAKHKKLVLTNALRFGHVHRFEGLTCTGAEGFWVVQHGGGLQRAQVCLAVSLRSRTSTDVTKRNIPLSCVL